MARTTIRPRQKSSGTWSAAALFVAGLWGVGLLIGAATLPAYESTTASVIGTADGSVASTSTRTATLIDVNGAGVLVVVSVPLAAVAVVSASLLWRRRRRGGAGPFAWTVVGLLGGLAFLGIMTIGIFILPSVVLLAIACATAPQSRHRGLPPPPRPGPVPTPVPSDRVPSPGPARRQSRYGGSA